MILAKLVTSLLSHRGKKLPPDPSHDYGENMEINVSRRSLENQPIAALLFNARRYAEDLERLLSYKGVPVNNTHRDNFGIIDFHLEGAVTISTVHKAKGNEAYQVYVAGADAIFINPDELNRNRIFTAMTRAKAWVTVTGLGKYAKECEAEIRKVATDFPTLKFNYPSQEYIKTMKRDMSKAARKRQIAERSIDEALKMMSPDEIQEYLSQLKK